MLKFDIARARQSALKIFPSRNFTAVTDGGQSSSSSTPKLFQCLTSIGATVRRSTAKNNGAMFYIEFNSKKTTVRHKTAKFASYYDAQSANRNITRSLHLTKNELIDYVIASHSNEDHYYVDVFPAHIINEQSSVYGNFSYNPRTGHNTEHLKSFDLRIDDQVKLLLEHIGQQPIRFPAKECTMFPLRTSGRKRIVKEYVPDQILTSIGATVIRNEMKSDEADGQSSMFYIEHALKRIPVAHRIGRFSAPRGKFAVATRDSARRFIFRHSASATAIHYVIASHSDEDHYYMDVIPAKNVFKALTVWRTFTWNPVTGYNTKGIKGFDLRDPIQGKAFLKHISQAPENLDEEEDVATKPVAASFGGQNIYKILQSIGAVVNKALNHHSEDTTVYMIEYKSKIIPVYHKVALLQSYLTWKSVTRGCPRRVNFASATQIDPNHIEYIIASHSDEDHNFIDVFPSRFVRDVIVNHNSFHWNVSTGHNLEFMKSFDLRDQCQAQAFLEHISRPPILKKNVEIAEVKNVYESIKISVVIMGRVLSDLGVTCTRQTSARSKPAVYTIEYGGKKILILHKVARFQKGYNNANDLRIAQRCFHLPQQSVLSSVSYVVASHADEDHLYVDVFPASSMCILPPGQKTFFWNPSTKHNTGLMTSFDLKREQVQAFLDHISADPTIDATTST